MLWIHVGEVTLCTITASCLIKTLCRSAAESFATTDQQYLAADGNQNRDDGCTAVAAVLIGNRLVVANVGDSRAVLSRNSQGASV